MDNAQLAHLGELNQKLPHKLVCVEINPPRGTDVAAALKRFEGRLEGIDFLNVTDSALAKMRLAALPFAALAKQNLMIEPLVNVSCRDRNLIALQGDLLAAWAQGVRAIVALTGDAVSVGDDPERKGVFEVNSIGLLQTIRTLNSGRDLVGNELKGAPKFISGVVVNPNVRNPAAEVRRLEKKAQAGATFALSQPVFDLDNARAFFALARAVPIRILLGLLPFKSAAGLEAIGNIPGIRIAQALLERARASSTTDLSEFSLEFCLDLSRELSTLVDGYHVIGGPTPTLGLELARRLAKRRQSL